MNILNRDDQQALFCYSCQHTQRGLGHARVWMKRCLPMTRKLSFQRGDVDDITNLMRRRFRLRHVQQAPTNSVFRHALASGVEHEARGLLTGQSSFCKTRRWSTVCRAPTSRGPHRRSCVFPVSAYVLAHNPNLRSAVVASAAILNVWD